MAAVVVAGLGYAGLPLAIRAVSVGHEVVGYDTDALRVKRLEAGESYVEDVSSRELAGALNSGRFRLSADADVCTGFDVAFSQSPPRFGTACPTWPTSRRPAGRWPATCAPARR